MLAVIRYELNDLARSKGVLVYALFFLLLTEGLLRFGQGSAQAVLSLVNVVLLLIPLVSLIFGAMYLYQARPFLELMLAQPVRRPVLFFGLYVGLALPLSLAFLLGVGLPFALRGFAVGTAGPALATLLGAGVLLTAIFCAVAFAVATVVQDRVRGLGWALGLWLGCTLLYDAAVLMALQALAAYPLDGPVLGMMLLNPVDLARVLLLLRLDVAALMGYTGAVFADVLGGWGLMLALGALLAWLLLPLGFGFQRFRMQDF